MTGAGRGTRAGPIRFWRILVRVTLFGVFTLVVVAGVWWWRLTHRPQPTNLRQTLFRGVTYHREVLLFPRPLVIHVVKVDTLAPGIGFLVTPGDPDRKHPLVSRTTSQFLREFRLQVAINGDFAFPWHSRGLWDYYPRVGDPVSVNGVAASRGVVYSRDDGGRDTSATVYLSESNELSLDDPGPVIYNAISGELLFVHGGRLGVPELPLTHYELHPRTALGIDRSRRHLLLVAVDGRQPGYSEGVNMEELGEILLRHGAYDAVNLDGGGSTTIVMQDRKSGQPLVLNSPIDKHIPGWERPVGNHLGVFAKRAK